MKSLELSYIKSGEQLAHFLTKGLGSKEWNNICNKMGMIDIYRPSWGGVLNKRIAHGPVSLKSRSINITGQGNIALILSSLIYLLLNRSFKDSPDL